jgi:hypothetical protein
MSYRVPRGSYGIFALTAGIGTNPFSFHFDMVCRD